MRFSTIFVYLALTVGLAIAGPLTDRDTGPSLKDTGNSTQPNPEDPEGQKLPTHAGPEGEEAKIRIFGDKGATTKRVDYNPLDERDTGSLNLCYYAGCTYCYSFNLRHYEYDRCYWVNYRYYSVYVYSYRHLHYGVYVGYFHYPSCQGTFSTKSFTYLFGTL